MNLRMIAGQISHLMAQLSIAPIRIIPNRSLPVLPQCSNSSPARINYIAPPFLGWTRTQAIQLFIFGWFLLLGPAKGYTQWYDSYPGRPIPEKPLLHQPIEMDSFHMAWFERDLLKYYLKERYDSMALLGKYTWEKARLAYQEDTSQIVFSILSLGKGSYAQGRSMIGYFEEGLPLIEETLRDAEKRLGPIIRLSHSYVGLGLVAAEFGDLEKEVWAYHQAARIISLNIKEGDPRYGLVGNKYNLLGKAYRKSGKYEQSLNMFYKAIEAYRKVENKTGIFNMKLNIAKLYTKSQLFQTAWSAWSEARNYLNTNFKANNFNWAKANLLFIGGDIAYAQGQYDTALDYYQRTENLAQSIPDASRLLVSIKHQLADTYIARSQFDQAVPFLEEAKQIWRKEYTTKSDIWNELLLTQAETELGSKRWKDALITLEQLASHYRVDDPASNPADWSPHAFPLNQDILTAFTLRAKAVAMALKVSTQYSKDDLLAICTAGQAYLDRLASSLTHPKDQSKLVQRNKYLFDKPMQLYSQQYQSAHYPSALDSLFQISERARAMNLRAQLQQKQLQTSMGLPEQLRSRELNAKKKQELYKQKLTEALKDTSENQALIIAYQQQLRNYENELHQTLAEIKTSYPFYYQIQYNRSSLTLSEVAAQLQADEILISYYWGEEELVILALNGSAHITRAIPINDKLVHALDAFSTYVRERPTEPSEQAIAKYCQQAFFLYKQLLSPVVDQLQGTRLILLPDGKLNYLPWAALNTQLADAPLSFRHLPYLIRDYTIRQEYAAAMLYQNVNRPKPEYPYLGYAPRYGREELAAARGTDSFLIRRLYPTLYRNGLPQLKKSVPEVEQSYAYFPDGIPFLQEEATESAFKQHSQSGSIQHFSMHAFTNDQDPMRSMLAFSRANDSKEDGLLYAYEIYNMDIPAEIAVLSACSTGDGAFLEGQGVMSLAHAFKYAGCKDVLMTQWLADDEASYQLVTRFFRNLKEGNEKDKALRNATLAYLNEGSPNPYAAHPHYWAGFALIGQGEALSTLSNNIIWITAALMIIGLGLFLTIKFLSSNKALST